MNTAHNLLSQEIDGVKWAGEFAKRYRIYDTDHEVMTQDQTKSLMISWFCNAIMAGYERGQSGNPAILINDLPQLKPTIPEEWHVHEEDDL